VHAVLHTITLDAAQLKKRGCEMRVVDVAGNMGYGRTPSTSSHSCMPIRVTAPVYHAARQSRAHVYRCTITKPNSEIPLPGPCLAHHARPASSTALDSSVTEFLFF
jgi:hypothetical protein